MLSPLDSAVRDLGIEPIGAVGEEVLFDSCLHQAAGAVSDRQPGDSVKVKFVGYRRGDEILRRAQVEKR